MAQIFVGALLEQSPLYKANVRLPDSLESDAKEILKDFDVNYLTFCLYDPMYLVSDWQLHYILIAFHMYNRRLITGITGIIQNVFFLLFVKLFTTLY